MLKFRNQHFLQFLKVIMIASQNNYFQNSKNVIVSLVFILPFLALYELICFFYFVGESYQIRNSADVIIRDFFNIFGLVADQFYALTLLAVLFFIFFINKSEKNKFPIKYNFLIIMLIEGVLLGFLMLILLNNSTIFNTPQYLYQDDLLLNLYLCIGAGIWEEILFRLFIFSILFTLLGSIFKDKAILQIYLSLIISSLLFSLFHYIGNNADVFQYNTFIIRFVGGFILGVIYFYRGFGISVMAHISYDFILVSLPLIYTT